MKKDNCHCEEPLGDEAIHFLNHRVMDCIAVLAMTFFLLVNGSAVHAAELRLDMSVCRLVKKHVPDADVAYKPDVDVNGKAVVPADLNPSSLGKLEDQIRIRLTNETAKIFGLNLPHVKTGNGHLPLADPEMEIGYITLKDGKPYLNGRPLQPEAADELVVLCNRD